MTEPLWMATAAFGLEGVVAGELRRLGMAEVKAENGGAFFEGGIEDALKANLYLRCADRVLLRLAEFEARSFDELFEGTRQIAWEKWLNKEAKIPVAAHCARSQLMSDRDVQSIVKKAIVQRLGAKYRLQRLPETGAEYPVVVSVHENRVQISLNTSGAGLSRRGYRTWNGEAPLRETLAAAMVMLSPWRPGMPLLDPMCGSGTLPIEAAMIALDRAPGLQRNFTMEKWETLDKKAAALIRQEAKDRVKKEPLEICGSDIDEEVLELARRHLKQAGLAGAVRFSRCDAKDVVSSLQSGAVLVNPPYGERLGDRKQAEQAITVLSQLQRRLGDWSLTAISPHPAFERQYGMRAEKKRRVYNGRLECAIYQFSPRKRESK